MNSAYRLNSYPMSSKDDDLLLIGLLRRWAMSVSLRGKNSHQPLATFPRPNHVVLSVIARGAAAIPRNRFYRVHSAAKND